MGKNLVQKILERHLVSGRLKANEDIAISIDQTLTQDATGTMAYLQPLVFQEPDEFQKVKQGDRLRITNLRDGLRVNGLLEVENITQQRVFEVHHGLNQREIEILLGGGLLNYTRNRFGTRKI